MTKRGCPNDGEALNVSLQHRTNLPSKMTKQKLLSIIPMAIVTGLMIHCWIIILFTDVSPEWRHYLGLTLWLVLIFLYLKTYRWAILATGIYLLLATCNVLAMTPVISTSWLTIGPVCTPPVQGLSLILFVLYAVLNIEVLIDMSLQLKKSRTPKED